MEQSSVKGKNLVLFFLKCLFLAYTLTGVLLMALSFLMYQAGMDEKAVSIAIIVIYVAATFFSGFLAGKKMQNRKFIWGLVEGVAYFVILALISFAVGEKTASVQNSFFTTLLLCAGGGMLGGMLS